MSPDEKALALQQAMSMSAPQMPSQAHNQMNQRVNEVMDSINTLHKQGVSLDRLNPYILQLMEEKSKLLNEEPNLNIMDEMSKPKQEFY